MRFKTKLLSTCAVALILFCIGTFKYMGKPYQRDVYKEIKSEQHQYMLTAQQAIDSAQRYECIDDDANTDYYLGRAVLYYHMSDSMDKAAELQLPKTK